MFQRVSQTSACIHITWWSCQKEDSVSAGLGWGLRFCITKKLRGNAHAAGPLTKLWVVRPTRPSMIWPLLFLLSHSSSLTYCAPATLILPLVNNPVIVLPQGLCTCCCRWLEHAPRYLRGLLSHLLHHTFCSHPTFFHITFYHLLVFCVICYLVTVRSLNQKLSTTKAGIFVLL